MREKEKKREKKRKRKRREERERRKRMRRGNSLTGGRRRKERRSIRGLGGVGRSSAGRCVPLPAGHPRNISGPSPARISCGPQHSLPWGAPLFRPCWLLTEVPTPHRHHALLRPVRTPSHRRATRCFVATRWQRTSGVVSIVATPGSRGSPSWLAVAAGSWTASSSWRL